MLHRVLCFESDDLCVRINLYSHRVETYILSYLIEKSAEELELQY